MRVSILGSGSKGNSILAVGGDTRVLLDAGFSAKELERRLGLIGVSPETIDAIVVTHDHRDHTSGAGIFARRHQTPVFLTQPTLDACQELFRGGEELKVYRPGFPFTIGRLSVEPFLTVHDAREPVAVAVKDLGTGLKLGVATDLGRPTTQVRHALADSDLLVLEANHDEGLLHQSPYPPSVKSRIASSHGHLSNEAAARFALELLHPRLACVVLAHLSFECNRPALAESVIGTALRDAGYRGLLRIAEQETPTELMDLQEMRHRLEPEQLTLM